MNALPPIPSARAQAFRRRWRTPIARPFGAGLVALALAGAAQAQACPEPSARDLAPTATPLTVTRADPTHLLLRWENVSGVDGYRVHRGTLNRLFGLHQYDHVVVSEVAAPTATIADPGGDLYFVVDSQCAGVGGSVGRDSSGNERPYGGILHLVLAIQGGAQVYAVQMNIDHPPLTTFMPLDFARAIGPFAPGSNGSPIAAIGAPTTDEVVAATLFTQTSPDPSFDPSPSSPTNVFDFFVGYHGLAPPQSDFTLGNCVVNDIIGNDVAGAVCEISTYQVLY